MCQGGQIVHWEDPCFLDPPSCPGPEEILSGECCPTCQGTWSPYDTTQQPEVTFPAGNCFIDGTHHLNGTSNKIWHFYQHNKIVNAHFNPVSNLIDLSDINYMSYKLLD